MAHHESPKKADSGVHSDNHAEEDGYADVFATVAIVTVVISTVCYWLSGMA